MELQYASLGLIFALDRQWAFAFIDLGRIGVYGLRLGPICAFMAFDSIGEYGEIEI